MTGYCLIILRKILKQISLYFIFLILISSSLNLISKVAADSKEMEQIGEKAKKFTKDLLPSSIGELENKLPDIISGEQFDKSLNWQNSQGDKLHDSFREGDNKLPESTETVLNRKNLEKLNQDYKQNKPQLKPEDKIFREGANFIEKADETLDSKWSYKTNEAKYEYYNCREEGEPYYIDLNRELKLKLNYIPKDYIKYELRGKNFIKAYEYFDDFREGYNFQEELREQFKNDPDVAEGHAILHGKTKDGREYHYVQIIVSYHIHDEDPACDSSNKIDLYLANKTQIREELWASSNEEDYKKGLSDKCTLINHKCLDSGMKIIDGKEITRPCWSYQLKFICKQQVEGKCRELRAFGCEQIEANCLEYNGSNCILWDKKYRCNIVPKKLVRKSDKNKKTKLYGEDEKNFMSDVKLNQSLPSVLAKLGIFETLEKEGEKFNGEDFKFLGGQNLKCAKNIAEGVFYDCCGSFDGLAASIGLTDCDSEEELLAAQRSADRCEYVGEYKRYMLNMWESSNKKSFCCFNSKLIKVLQREARKQLGIGWGTPEEPNCTGLTTEQIKSLDFNKMELGELYEQFMEQVKQDLGDSKLTPPSSIDELPRNNINEIEGVSP